MYLISRTTPQGRAYLAASAGLRIAMDQSDRAIEARVTAYRRRLHGAPAREMARAARDARVARANSICAWDAYYTARTAALL